MGMSRILTLCLSVLALPVMAQGRLADHERAEAAVARGAILPLADVLQSLARQHPGEVIEVELDEEDGVLVYDLDMVTPDGRLIEVEVDAVTGIVLEVENDDDDGDDDDDD